MRKAGATHVVAVMSGNYVQRGEPAIFDKFRRAQAAVIGGVDLVLELPLPWAVASAERFSTGMVAVAVGTGVADGFSFGCETAELSMFQRAAALSVQPGFQEKIKDIRRDGSSYPAAAAKICGDTLAAMFSQPNNILGVEYVKALMKYDFQGHILPVQRFAAAHDALKACDSIASAMFIRNLLATGKMIDLPVPDGCAELYASLIDAGFYVKDKTSYERQLLTLLRAAEKSVYDAIPDAVGGFGDRVYRAVRQASSLEEVYALIKCKRFTFSSVRRAVLCAALGVTADTVSRQPPYIRVLAMNDKGKSLLRQMRKQAELPVLMRHADTASLDGFGKKVYDLECRATDIYNTLTARLRPCGTNMTDNVFILGEK